MILFPALTGSGGSPFWGSRRFFHCSASVCLVFVWPPPPPLPSPTPPLLPPPPPPPPPLPPPPPPAADGTCVYLHATPNVHTPRFAQAVHGPFLARVAGSTSVLLRFSLSFFSRSRLVSSFGLRPSSVSSPFF